ncbi:RING-type domain-containing protein [Phanerochaete sordida]|uniref:RING-type domain-containing protein n=1 Tax=Phanerochaete sordida TaxID=48140 RepID=A0A9P3GHL8_9APHY|nr:RING-type domain-containing protein [Phanerochaete sordida]
MSNLEQAPQQDFDFWDYVTCSRCHLSFTPDNGGPPPVPFWVTECGHVVCNNHLRTDQSCAKCGQRDIQVAPLQRDMDPPMSNWFSSAPQALDTLAFTTRFQIESLASLVRYYKRKCAHQRSLIERMRPAIQENKDLRRALEGVQNETCQSQNYMEPSGMPNGNGKRQMLQISRYRISAL